MNDDDGMNLTAAETSALAWRLVARQAADSYFWLDWGNVPNLGEYAYERLGEAVRAVADEVRAKSEATDRRLDVDSSELLERLS